MATKTAKKPASRSAKATSGAKATAKTVKTGKGAGVTAKAGKGAGAAAKTGKTATAKMTKVAKSTKATGKRGASAKQAGAKREEQAFMRRVKSTSWIAILESLAIGVFGALFLMNPSGLFKFVFYVVGIFLIIKGVYKVMNYFAIRGRYDFYNNDLLYGIIALVFGILAIVLWEELGQLIGIAVGAWMIYGSLVRMNTAIKMHTAGIRDWFYVLVLAMIMLGLGIYMVISASAIPVVIGWIMIVAAVVGIVDDVLLIRHLGKVAK